MSTRKVATAATADIQFTVWANKLGKTARRFSLPWGGFVERLEQAPRKQRKHRAKLVKLATFGESRTARSSLRHDANVLKITGVEGDYDGEQVSPEEAVARLEESGIRAVVVTTWTHTPDAPRWRVFAPLSGPVPPPERARFVAVLDRVLGGILGAESYTLSQSFFVGGKPGGDYRVLCTFGDPDAGRCLDDLGLDEGSDDRVPTTSGGGGGAAPTVDGEIPSGCRNRTLLSLAGTMRRRGMEEPEIRVALMEVNRGRCKPPVSEREVGQIASNVSRYEPGAPVGGEFLSVGLDDFHAYLPEHRYIFIPTRALWPAASVNGRIAPIGEGRSKVKASAWLDDHRSVEQMTWAPGQPMLIEDRLIAQGGWIDKSGVTCFNLYRPPTIELGDPSGAGRWVDHVHLVYPSEAEHIIRWCAHRVQRPGEKINHALLLQGPQGTGKDTIIEGFIPAIGEWNCHEVSPDQLLGRFTGFVKSVVLRVSEARDLGERDRYRLYDHLKTFTAAPPMVLRVDEKHIREYVVPNVCGVVITTNYVDGVYLSADDRRHFVACTEKTKEDYTEEYWNELYRWYEKEGGYGHVAAYLAQLDISDFNPKAPPPKTPAFWAAVDSGRAPEDAEFADVLDDLGRPDAVTRSAIVERARTIFETNAPDDFVDWLLDRRNSRQIPHRMAAVGYVAVRNDARKDGRWKIHGRGVVVYARIDLSVRGRITAARQLVAESRR